MSEYHARLGDVADLLGGRYLPREEYVASEGLYAVYGSNSVMGVYDKYLYDGPLIILARIGSNCGSVMWSAKPAWVNNNASAIRVRPGTDARYIYYWLRVHDMAPHRLGSGQPFISHESLANTPIVLPSLGGQRAIAEVLGALDDKIEANERLLQTARGLLAARFELLVASRSAGWRRSSLGDHLEVLETGSRPKGGVSRFRAGVPSLGAESVLGLAAYDYSKTKYVPDEFFASMKRGVVEDLDVLLYKDGGRPGEFEPHVSLLGNGFPFPRFCINEHVYRLRVRPPLTQEFLYCWLSGEQTMEEMRRRGTGVAIPGLNSSAVRGLAIDVPPSSILEEFSLAARPLVQLALEVAKESRILAELRDTLLPPLISGELRVRDAEAVVGDAM